MKPIVVALIGNPNSGKTTLFNSLTGCQQKVGNWPGVTVEKKRKACQNSNIPLEIVDLPGCYSVESFKDNLHDDVNDVALDEKLTQEYLTKEHEDEEHEDQASVIVNVVDATSLERHLYLSLQLLEQKKPVVIAVNLSDIAKKQGLEINYELLQESLQCPVIPIVAANKHSLGPLKQAIIGCAGEKMSGKTYAFGNQINDYSRNGNQKISIQKSGNQLNSTQTIINQTNGIQKNNLSEIQIAEQRYQFIRQLIQKAVKRKSIQNKKEWTQKWDALLLHKFLGVPIFFLIMYLVFTLTAGLGGAVQDRLVLILQSLFVEGPKTILVGMHAPQWVIHLISGGIGLGIQTTLSFVPVIAVMFFCLSILEASGYMARAAFLMDRVMHWVGLTGKSFVPMILGFGCNVPAILGARTLENRRDRILTIMMIPFMSCGARLAIYALFVSAFFKENGANIIFALYLIGILVALITAGALRSTLIKQDPSPLVMELPAYRWPNLRRILQIVVHRLNHFLSNASIIIIPLCALMGTLSCVKIEGEPWLTHIGRAATPVFAPMGIQQDNWPAAVGLLSGVLAKEVVVGTLNTLYENEEYQRVESDSAIGEARNNEGKSRSIQEESLSNQELLNNKELSNRELLSNQGSQSSGSKLGNMVERFGGKISAFSYLIFVLLYFPCVSVLATMARELSLGWAVFSAVWTTSLAYMVSVLFYQSMTFFEHKQSSFLWVVGLLSLFFLNLSGMKRWAQAKKGRESGEGGVLGGGGVGGVGVVASCRAQSGLNSSGLKSNKLKPVPTQIRVSPSP